MRKKYTVPYRLNPVINEHHFYGTLQSISTIVKQQKSHYQKHFNTPLELAIKEFILHMGYA